MRQLIALAVAASAAWPAFAADNASCKLSADRKTVSVVATNPYGQPMQCEVNCNMAVAGGISTAVCVKPVPVGAKDLVMCTEPADQGHPYTAIKGSEVKCADPTAEVAPADSQDDADSDAHSDALIKKMQEQSADMLKRLHKK